MSKMTTTNQQRFDAAEAFRTMPTEALSPRDFQRELKAMLVRHSHLVPVELTFHDLFRLWCPVWLDHRNRRRLVEG